MAQTPILPDAVVLVEANDENDPAGTFNAYLVQGEGDQETYTEIATSAYSDDTPLENQKNFLWAMSCLAKYHNITLQNETGVTAP